MPDTKRSITHKFDIAGREGYVTVGVLENGQPCELFITMTKEGTTIGGLLDTIGTLISTNLQAGVPVQKLVDKFINTRFELSGRTDNSDIPIAKSIHRLPSPMDGH